MERHTFGAAYSILKGGDGLKNGKRLTRAQKIMLSSSGLLPANYLVVKDQQHSMILLNRKTGKTEVFTKNERKVQRMIISVKFKSKKTQTYSGRGYSYFCNIPVKPGDYVKVPAGESEAVALVAEINVPESRVDERVLPVMKSVISIADPPKQASDLPGVMS